MLKSLKALYIPKDKVQTPKHSQKEPLLPGCFTSLGSSLARPPDKHTGSHAIFWKYYVHFHFSAFYTCLLSAWNNPPLVIY